MPRGPGPPSSGEALLAGCVLGHHLGQHLGAHAGELGYATEYRALKSAELEAADGLWLVSSGQQIRPVNTLDGIEMPRDRELDAALLEKLLYRKR